MGGGQSQRVAKAQVGTLQKAAAQATDITLLQSFVLSVTPVPAQMAPKFAAVRATYLQVLNSANELQNSLISVLLPLEVFAPAVEEVLVPAVCL